MDLSLLDKLKNSITAITRKRILLAVSGGMDSCVLAEVLHQMDIDFGIAHCNFQLRAEESHQDEAFVKTVAAKYNVPIYTTCFDTQQYAAQKKVSIQVAARDLRYTWLEEMRATHRYDYIATAHHLNDNIETVLHNFIKGTGIKGLRGMQVKQGRVIRPLLAVSRAAIEAFQKEHQLLYREDSSNASDKYTRNKIRHHLLPLIEEINPGFEAGFVERLKIFTEIEGLFETRMSRIEKQLFLKRGADIYIPIRLLRKQTNSRSLLFEYLQPHGFNAAQVDDILDALPGDSGKQFLTTTARLIKDRQFLILTTSKNDFTTILVQPSDTEIILPQTKVILTIKDASTVAIKKDKSYAYLDADKLEFPLILRNWKMGDYFYPFGMKLKKQKVSKYFKDHKIPVHEKERVWLLESNQKIVWLVGERIDERYKVTENTKKILVMNVLSREWLICPS